MNEATIALTVMTFLIFLAFLFFLIWGIKAGQFRDVEEAKYIMFKDEEQPGEVQRSDVDHGTESEEGR